MVRRDALLLLYKDPNHWIDEVFLASARRWQNLWGVRGDIICFPFQKNCDCQSLYSLQYIIYFLNCFRSNVGVMIIDFWLNGQDVFNLWHQILLIQLLKSARMLVVQPSILFLAVRCERNVPDHGVPRCLEEPYPDRPTPGTRPFTPETQPFTPRPAWRVAAPFFSSHSVPSAMCGDI
jgi:hypothetical protein